MLALVLAGCAAPSAPDPDMDGGRAVYPTCGACHGTAGTGGAGPALTNVLATFPDCETHIRWIRLGSERWKAEVGPTYGTGETEVDQVMPSFEELGETTIRQVAMYERVRFGGGDPEEQRTACGLG